MGPLRLALIACLPFCALAPASDAQQPPPADEAAILAAFQRKLVLSQGLAAAEAKLLKREREALADLAAWGRAHAAAEWEAPFRELAAACGAVGAADGLVSAAATAKPPPKGTHAEWPARLAVWRREMGKEWARLARDAQRARRDDFAVRAAKAALLRDPSQSDARGLLCQELIDGAWRSAWWGAKVRSGEVWTDEAGWVKASDSLRLRAGELLVDGKWCAAVEGRRVRANWRTPWEVRCARWTVRGNVAPAWLLRVCQAIDAGHVEANALFAGAVPIDRAENLYAMVFGDKSEYDEEADLNHGGETAMKSTTGYFQSSDRTIHLVLAPDRPIRMARLASHEATHALIDSAARGASGAPIRVSKGNFLLNEAPALVVEERVGLATGKPNTVADGDWSGLLLDLRGFTSARSVERLLLPTWTADGSTSLEQRYALALALGRFLFEERDLRRREAAVEYLWQYYLGHATADLFPKLAGQPWEKLEADWAAYLERLAQGK